MQRALMSINHCWCLSSYGFLWYIQSWHVWATSIACQHLTPTHEPIRVYFDACLCFPNGLYTTSWLTLWPVIFKYGLPGLSTHTGNSGFLIPSNCTVIIQRVAKPGQTRTCTCEHEASTTQIKRQAPIWYTLLVHTYSYLLHVCS